MNRLKATNSVPFANRDTAPGTGTPQYATNGNPQTGTPATIWPAYMFNMIMDELMAVIAAAGLTPNDTDWTQLLQALFAVPGKNVSRFTSSGTFTVPAGVRKVRVTCVGGGGGGAGCTPSGSTYNSSAGGGAGGAAIGIYTVTPGQPVAVTVGAGGTGGVAANGAGTQGGTSSFGAFCSATGGGFGFWQTATTSPGGAGGSATGGTILNATGGFGGDGVGTATPIPSGYGGTSIFGGSGRSAINGNIGGQAPGAGGGGSYQTSGPGGDGADGIVIVEW